MRLLLAIALALAAAIPALATPQDPVLNVLAAASHDWRQDITENEDYFSDERVRTLYSHAFVKSLTEASALASANDDGKTKSIRHEMDDYAKAVTEGAQ